MKNLVDFEGHCLAGPHVGNLSKPAIWRVGSASSARKVMAKVANSIHQGRMRELKGKAVLVPLMVGCVISLMVGSKFQVGFRG